MVLYLEPLQTMEMIKILIVDNDIQQQHLHKFLLERYGYVCDCVAFLESAIQSLKLFEYDLIISDFHLPDGDGIQLKLVISTLKKYLPIIFIASKLNQNLLKPTKGRALVSYLSKPISSDDLYSSVKAALELAANLNAPQELFSIAKLKIIEGKILKKGLEISEICLSKTITFGRQISDSYCDYQIPDSRASRHHATFVRLFKDKLLEGSEDGFNLWDGEVNGQKSANGCKINGRKILCQDLRSGDIVILPGVIMEFLAINEGGCLIDKDATLT